MNLKNFRFYNQSSDTTVSQTANSRLKTNQSQKRNQQEHNQLFDRGSDKIACPTSPLSSPTASSDSTIREEITTLTALFPYNKNSHPITKNQTKRRDPSVSLKNNPFQIFLEPKHPYKFSLSLSHRRSLLFTNL